MIPAAGVWKWSSGKFNIPSGATIDGLEITLHVAMQKDDLVIELSPDNNAWGDSKTLSPDYEKKKCIDAIDETFGSSSDLWGGTWTPANINNDVYIRLTGIENTTGKNIYVDSVQLTVYYTLAPTPTPTPTPTPEPTTIPTVTPTPTPTSAPGPAVGGPAAPGPAEPPVCGATIPSAPTLLSATSIGIEEVELVWTAVDNVTHYSISYSPSPGNYLYGVPDTGNVTSFRVGNLDPAINYCFAVRAVNDCAPSSLSNEICLGRVATGEVLGVTTLADTGSFDRESLELIIFTIGCLCIGTGLNLRSAKD